MFFCFFLHFTTFYPTQNPLFPNRSRLDCWGRGMGVLVQQVLICEGNKPQIQSNHIIIHRKNLFFLLKAGPGLKCKFDILFRQNTYLQNKKHTLTCQRWDWLL